MLDSGEANDRFGEVITLLDFQRDGRLDLVVGIPYEDVGAIADAGDLSVMFGVSWGITSTGNIRLNQGTPGMQGTVEAGDMLGGALGR